MFDVEIHKAIRAAIKQGDTELVTSLIGNDESRLKMLTPFGTWLHVAASKGKLDIIKWLIQRGADVNAGGGTFEGSPLLFAVGDGHLDVAKYLLENGADMDVSDSVRNPLFRAIIGGHTEIAKLLIEQGIDTAVRYSGESMKDMDALAFAKEWGRTDIASLLEAK